MFFEAIDDIMTDKTKDAVEKRLKIKFYAICKLLVAFCWGNIV